MRTSVIRTPFTPDFPFFRFFRFIFAFSSDPSPVRRREAPSFKTGWYAPLRVNLEQAPTLRPESRVVHFFSHLSAIGKAYRLPRRALIISHSLIASDPYAIAEDND